MATYNGKEFNGNVFEKYTKTIESTKELSMLKSNLLKRVSKYNSKFSEQAGGNYIVEPFKGRIGGEAKNYDGVTSLSDLGSRKSYKQGKIAISRMQGWSENDWANEITKTDWKTEASEITEYWDENLQSEILSILKGIFASTTNNFGTKHTYNVSGNLNADSFNKASQKVLGDKKRKLEIAFMHSAVSTNLESLQLLEYLKYTDKDGITRDLTIGQFNGKIVFIDDDMPVEVNYVLTSDTEIDSNKTYYTKSGSKYNVVVSPSKESISSYYEEDKSYVTYLMEKQYFEYEDLGVVTPYEVSRDAKTNGGKTDLISRRRFILVPDGISFTNTSTTNEIPTKEDLEKGTNWEPIKSSDGTEYLDDKLIPIVKIVSKG